MHGVEHGTDRIGYGNGHESVAGGERADGRESAENLLEAVRAIDSFSAAQKPINIERESQKIADHFDLSKPGNYSDKITAGAELLSKDLRSLSGNMEKYNRLLNKVQEKTPEEPAVTPWIEMGSWNDNTGTWDNVRVRSGDNFDAYRIVQPGNSLSEISVETYKDSRELAEALGIESNLKKEMGENPAEYMSKLVELNKIADPNKIYPGQALKLRDTFIWF